MEQIPSSKNACMHMKVGNAMLSTPVTYYDAHQQQKMYGVLYCNVNKSVLFSLPIGQA